ncbi:MAG: 7-carboxy-7-deazaguanine synthase QueE [Candidatus Omnitrophica bacterium]|nr:7-carboxy-7-deazaguanine synthase QueE [Candidatus Omnitrophota bacterium]
MRKIKAKIAEIFKSIQGEGIYQGVSQVFLRFYGCNLNCKFCDTHLDFYQEMDLEEVLERIFSFDNYHSISLTGGEPLLQLDFLEEVLCFLKTKKKIIYLETNGILFENLKRIIDFVDIIAMDFKLPSSTGERDFWREHKKFLEIALKKEVFVKAVVCGSTEIKDILTSIAIIKEMASSIFFVLQPQHPFEDTVEEKLKLYQKICLEEGIKSKVIAQLHKFLGIK